MSSKNSLGGEGNYYGLTFTSRDGMIAATADVHLMGSSVRIRLKEKQNDGEYPA
jgi:hypothetical protein